MSAIAILYDKVLKLYHHHIPTSLWALSSFQTKEFWNCIIIIYQHHYERYHHFKQKSFQIVSSSYTNIIMSAIIISYDRVLKLYHHHIPTPLWALSSFHMILKLYHHHKPTSLWALSSFHMIEFWKCIIIINQHHYERYSAQTYVVFLGPVGFFWRKQTTIIFCFWDVWWGQKWLLAALESWQTPVMTSSIWHLPKA